jgi:hypothetical protein
MKIRKILIVMIVSFAATTINAQVVEWTKLFETSNYDQVGQSIAIDNNGNAYITGQFDGTVDFDPGPGVFNLTAQQRDIYVCKLDSTGGFVWAISVAGDGTTNNFDDMGKSIALDGNNNVYITGIFKDTVDFDPGPGFFNLIAASDIWSGTTYSDAFVLKLDINGDFLWARNLGGFGDENGISIAIDSADNVYTAGWFEYGGDFDPGVGQFNLSIPNWAQYGLYISKLDVNGDFVWAKTVGSNYNDYIMYYDRSIAMTLDESGFLYLLGVVSPEGTGTWPVLLSKFNLNGDSIWAKEIVGYISVPQNTLGGDNHTNGLHIASDPVGNIHITGVFAGTIDFDPGPAVYNLTADPNSYRKVFILKLDSNGDFLWAKSFGHNTVSRSICLDNSGNVYTTGIFENYADFDPGLGLSDTLYLDDYDFASTLGDACFISKLDSNGDFLWADGMLQAQQSNALVVADNGDIYATGSGWGSGINNGRFIRRFSQPGFVSSVSYPMKKGLEIFPNPANNFINVLVIGEKILYNSIGKEMLRTKKEQIDVSLLSKGVYFIKTNSSYAKFIKH